MLKWLEALGFDSLNSTTSVVADDMKTLLTDMHNTMKPDLKSIWAILGKDDRSLAKFKKLSPQNDTFVKRMLEFINGAVRTLGLAIKKKKKGDTTIPYILENKYKDFWISEPDASKPNTPVILKSDSISDFIMGDDEDPEDSDDEE